MSRKFNDQYTAWLTSALKQFNKRYDQQRSLFIAPDGEYEPGELVEFSEDGSAYPHGRGGTGFIRKAVTPWTESEYFVA